MVSFDSRINVFFLPQVKDALPAKATDADVSKFRGQFETCAVGCVDEAVAKMPDLTKKVKEKIQLGAF